MTGPVLTDHIVCAPFIVNTCVADLISHSNSYEKQDFYRHDSPNLLFFLAMDLSPNLQSTLLQCSQIFVIVRIPAEYVSQNWLFLWSQLTKCLDYYV